VHLVADPAQGVPGVALRIPGADRGEDGVERRVLVPQVLELDQLASSVLSLLSSSAGVIRKRMLLRSHFSGTTCCSRR